MEHPAHNFEAVENLDPGSVILHRSRDLRILGDTVEIVFRHEADQSEFRVQPNHDGSLEITIRDMRDGDHMTIELTNMEREQLLRVLRRD